MNWHCLNHFVNALSGYRVILLQQTNNVTNTSTIHITVKGYTDYVIDNEIFNPQSIHSR